MSDGRIVRMAKITALAGLVLVSLNEGVASTVVYRCLDARLGVVYTDLPCKDGDAFDTRAGEADPAALARLDRLRDALDQSAVQRLSDERRFAAARMIPLPAPRESEGPSADTSAYDGYYTYPVEGYVSTRPHPPRHRPSHHRVARGTAPAPPYVVPRQ